MTVQIISTTSPIHKANLDFARARTYRRFAHSLTQAMRETPVGVMALAKRVKMDWHVIWNVKQTGMLLLSKAEVYSLGHMSDIFFALGEEVSIKLEDMGDAGRLNHLERCLGLRPYYRKGIHQPFKRRTVRLPGINAPVGRLMVAAPALMIHQ